MWIGLLGGIAEVLKLVAGKLILQVLLFRTADAFWAAPLSLAILCALVAVPLALLTPSRLVQRYPAFPFFVLLFLALASFTAELPKLHASAKVILAAGIAAQLSRWTAKRTGAVVRVARRTTAPILALVLLTPIGIRLFRRVAEHRSLASLPAAGSGAPNVLFLILDTVRAMDLSLYGYGRPTSPALDALAGRGIVFDQAFAPSSWTLATHASFFTGLHPFTTGVSWRTALDETYPTLAEVFERRGYVTAAFSANDLFVTREAGLSRGFAHFAGARTTLLSVLVESSLGRWLFHQIRRMPDTRQIPNRKRAPELREEVEGWFDRAPANRPYFVFINAFDAHEPYRPRAPFDTAFTGRKAPWRSRNLWLSADSRRVTPQEAQTERDAYDQSIAGQDHEIGKLFASLERSGRLRNTLVVVSSDHGEEFAELGLLGHAQTLHPSLLWVPLVVAFPNVLPAGARIPEPVSLIDLPATILALADTTRPVELPGIPLLGHRGAGVPAVRTALIAELTHPLEIPPWYPMQRGPFRALTLSGLHYIRGADGKERLLDIAADKAGRLVDLDSPAARAVLPRYRAILDSLSPP